MGGDAAAARAIERVCPPPPGYGRLGEQHHFAVRAGHWLAGGADLGGHRGQGLAAVGAAHCEQALRLALGRNPAGQGAVAGMSTPTAPGARRALEDPVALRASSLKGSSHTVSVPSQQNCGKPNRPKQVM